ncbi:hypothetical protein [Mesorhizobium sp. L103C119B0]|uniref:hypothetical protein n=1 Tax=Mesorhizobium sp. L103C119B0 TaxID=1287085 RepID=UPI00067F2680|nr:hypothetical protein [Mesorhizobium sp. L103C119B0]
MTMVKTIDDARPMMAALVSLPAQSKHHGIDPLALGQSSDASEAIANSDTSWLYRSLIDGFSYQGIRDSHARAYIEKHGNAEWYGVTDALSREGRSSEQELCPKLVDFDSYRGCRYRKVAQTCANPDSLATCPVPKLALRKGVLNEQAFSLYLFIRDECSGDLVAFIDRLLDVTNTGEDPVSAGREELLAAFTQVVGVSRKLAGMMLSQILLNAGPDRERWHAVGASVVVVDSLVHNFLHRTGTLSAYEGDHLYGERCYGPASCETILRDLAARLSTPAGSISPRSLQHAVWRFCAADQLAVCNGNNIRDTLPCQLEWCGLKTHCSRLSLRPAKPTTEEV